MLVCMSYPWLMAEYYRRKRLKHPEPTVVMLVEIMGVEWWISHGFYREYRVGAYYVDLASPSVQLAVEGDGRRFHLDAAREWQRDKSLQAKGWRVVHFPYALLHDRPADARQKMLDAWEEVRPRTRAETKLIHEQMRRSGFYI